MAESLSRMSTLREAAEAAARDLVSLKSRPDGVYLNLPLTYPSGASVVVRIDGGPRRFFVTDFAMGYIEADLMGATTLFTKHAGSIARSSGIGFDHRAFFVEVEREQIPRAIVAVANCSQEAVVLSAHKLSDKQHDDKAYALYQRLVHVFSATIVEHNIEVVGSTNTTWRVAALVHGRPRDTIFDVVSKHPVSVAFASAKFRDIAQLERPPNRVAVVSRKEELGTYLGVLQMDANVIERSAPDTTFARLAEAA